MLSRRQFLTLSGGAAATGAAVWAGLLRDHTSQVAKSSSLAPDTDNVLVVVQLTGGNDALNTVIPVDGRYHDLRPTLAIPDDQLVALQGETSVGLHPSLAPLKGMWEARQLALLPDVGFAANSRSHFDSLAVWWTASPEHSTQTGWLGRWLDSIDLARDNPLVAVSLGGGAVPALRAEHSLSTAVNDLATFQLIGPRGVSSDRLADAFVASVSPASTDPLLAQSQAAIDAAVRAVDVLGQATSPSTDEQGDLTTGLMTAATLIGMNLGTRVYLVSASGFDTHADQLTAHADLLTDFARGVVAFFDALGKSGHADRVTLMTTSEFGRRAQENASGGTDHGHGGAHFVVGPRVRGGLYGSVDLTGLVDGDLPCAVDTRALYAAGLDWLGGPSAELVDGHTDTYGLLTA